MLFFFFILPYGLESSTLSGKVWILSPWRFSPYFPAAGLRPEEYITPVWVSGREITTPSRVFLSPEGGR